MYSWENNHSCQERQLVLVLPTAWRKHGEVLLCCRSVSDSLLPRSSNNSFRFTLILLNQHTTIINFEQIQEDRNYLCSLSKLISADNCCSNSPTNDVGTGANVESSLFLQKQKLPAVNSLYGGSEILTPPELSHDSDYGSMDFDDPFRPDNFASQASPNSEVPVLDSPIKRFCGLAGSEDSEDEPIEQYHLMNYDNPVSYSPRPTVRESMVLTASPQPSESQLSAAFVDHAHISRSEPENGYNNGIEESQFYEGSSVTFVEAIQESSLDGHSSALQVPECVPRGPPDVPPDIMPSPFFAQANCDNCDTVLEEETVPQPIDATAL